MYNQKTYQGNDCKQIDNVGISGGSKEEVNKKISKKSMVTDSS
jgi:hypothetical protein